MDQTTMSKWSRFVCCMSVPLRRRGSQDGRQEASTAGAAAGAGIGGMDLEAADAGVWPTARVSYVLQHLYIPLGDSFIVSKVLRLF